MSSVTEIQLHVRALFPARMIWVPLNVWGGGDYIIGANRAEKSACSLFNYISITDDTCIKINEQNKSIGIGPLYIQTEFDL